MIVDMQSIRLRGDQGDAAVSPRHRLGRDRTRIDGVIHWHLGVRLHPNAVRLALSRRREARGQAPTVAPVLPDLA